MDQPNNLVDTFDPNMFTQHPQILGMDVSFLPSLALSGPEQETRFKLAIMTAFSMCGATKFVQNMDTFLSSLGARRNEFARMMAGYRGDWTKLNILAEMDSILGQQAAGPVMPQTVAAFSRTNMRGRMTYTSHRIVEPGVSNPYEPSAVYARAPQALEPPRPPYTYMTLPGKNKIPDTEAGTNQRSAKLDSSLFTANFESMASFKRKPDQLAQDGLLKPMPAPPAVPSDTLISQAKVKAVEEFQNSMAEPAATLMSACTARFMNTKEGLTQFRQHMAETLQDSVTCDEPGQFFQDMVRKFEGVIMKVLADNHEVYIAAQELVNAVTGGAGVQDEAKVISSDPDIADQAMDEDGGEISDEDDQPILDTLKGKPDVTDKPKDQSKGASLGNRASALSVAKVIMKRARANTGDKSAKTPVNRKTTPAKPKDKPETGPAKPGPAKPPTDPAKPPTDDTKLEATGAGEDW